MSDTLIIVTEKVGDRAVIAVLSQNLNPDILVMQPAQN